MSAAARKFDHEDFSLSADELPIGTKLLFGQFTIESFVNSGGFGIVYIARDSLDRKVVIKECFPSTFCRRVGKTVGARSRAQQDDFRSAVGNFMQEAQTLSKLNHPNIVKVHHVFEDNETAYMAMEYIDGPDFLQTVEGSARPLTPKEIVTHLTTMLDAVGYVHAQGLLHRDISPDNILLDKSTGRPILIDFGASRKEVTRKSRALSGLRVVKDGYSPQEFYVKGSTQSPCSDLYALAASFYHLISGETPKTSQERLSAIAGREGDPLRPLAGRFRAYPRAFLEAIDKAMSIFPRDRLQSVDDWRAMLGQDSAAIVVAPLAVAEAAQPAPAAVVAPVATPHPAVVTRVGDGSRSVMPTGLGSRNLLFTAAAAVVLLVGLLMLPEAFRSGGSSAPVPQGQASAERAEGLLVTNMLRLPGGLAFEMIETPTGVETIVSAVPEGFGSTVEVGDALLVYQPTGETLGTSTALRDILTREFGKGVTTYSFVIRRGASTMNADIRLQAAG